VITFSETAVLHAKPNRAKRIRKTRPARALPHAKIVLVLRRAKPRYMNLPLLVSILAICLFGLAMVYSASSYNAQFYFGNPFYYFTKQLIGFILGIVLLVFTYLFDYKFYGRHFKLILLGGILVLALVFVPGIGISKLGAKRWIGLGGFSIQPSELAKFAFVIFAAGVFAKSLGSSVLGQGVTPCKRDASGVGIPNIKRLFLVIAAGGILCALILAEPNLSITLCLGITMFCMLFLCGARVRHLTLLLLPALLLIPVLLVAEPYRIKRLVAFIDPWATPKAEGFQLIQSLYSLGNGGLFGVGFGNSTQKYMFLPFSESDFIFSIIGEEFGLVGCLLFIALLAFVIFRIFKVGTECPDPFGKYLCFGIATVIFVQSAINLAVVTGCIPPTGLPLPFVSFGGTSLAVFLSAIGIVLNVDKQNKKL
jgi:cell division protein FtsW